MDNLVIYSTNIEKFVRMRGMTMKEILEKIELSPSSYYGMKEKNQFSTKTLERFASALDVRVSDLVKENLHENVNELAKDFEKIKEKMKEFEDKHLK